MSDLDIISRRDESAHGRPLLQHVMTNGTRCAAGRATLDESRAHARSEVARLPGRIRHLAPADPPYRVHISPSLAAVRPSFR
jgi:nicotinate phosphoribosyltransferase